MRILVCLDGSTNASRVLPAVSRTLANVPDAEVHLLHVLNPAAARGKADSAFSSAEPRLTADRRAADAMAPRVVEDHGTALERVRHETLEELHDYRSQLPAGASVVSHAEFADHPADMIVKLANDLHVTAIAMSTHGRTGVRHLVMGSVTEQVLRHSPVPVLVVGPAAGQ